MVKKKHPIKNNTQVCAYICFIYLLTLLQINMINIEINIELKEHLLLSILQYQYIYNVVYKRHNKPKHTFVPQQETTCLKIALTTFPMGGLYIFCMGWWPTKHF